MPTERTPERSLPPASERWGEVSRVLDGALELPPDERAAFVARSCAGDAELRREVERLLAACERADRAASFLAEPADAFAAPVVADVAARSVDGEADVVPTLSVALAGRYAVEREIGRGGMAVVYLARDLKHGRPVAIKVLRPELAAALGPARFLREIEHAARLQHPHIVPLYDSGEVAAGHPDPERRAGDGPPLLYYVMPYVEGESLRERLEREGQLPLDEALRIAGEVAGALEYAHRHGVVHRDIKPENILLSSGQAVVADFGIARAITAAGGERLTETGLSLGTPAYMSPEQAAAEREIDGRSDIYSLGCVLYEMLAGEPPYTGPTAQAVIAKRLHEPVPRISTVRETVPEHVERAVTRALAKTPADRFGSAAELADVLRAAEKEGQQPPQRHASRWSRRQVRRRPVAISALLLVVLGAIGLWAGFRPGHVARQAPPSTMRIAVFPFEVRGGPESRWLGEAAMDLLSGAIDGVGELRRVDPHALMSRLRRDSDGDIDPERARRISASFGAGRYVLGTAITMGDRVHFSAALYDPVRGVEPVAAAMREGERADLSTLATLLAEMTRQLFARQPVGSGDFLAGISGVRAASDVAVRAYLEGEAMIRRGVYDSAALALRRAVEVDSTFAVGWYRLAHVASFGENVAEMMTSIDAAMRYRDQLSERDRLMADAYHAFMHGDGVVAERRALSVVGAYPGHVEGWWLLGLTRFWYAWQRGRFVNEARAPLERALALDPDHPPALFHLRWLAAYERRYDEVDSIAALPSRVRRLTTDDDGRRQRALGRVAASAFGRGDEAAQRDILSYSEKVSDAEVLNLAARIAAFTDDLPGARRVALLLTDPTRRAERARANGHLILGSLEYARGRRRDAAAEFARAAAWTPEVALVTHAWLAALPALQVADAELRALRDSLRRWTPATASPLSSQWRAESGVWGDLLPHARIYVLGLLSARLADADTALRYGTALEAVDAPFDSAGLLPDLALEIRALVLDQAGRPADALATLQRASMAIRGQYQALDPLHTRPFGRLLRADLLYRLNRRPEAVSWYEPAPFAFGRYGLDAPDFVYLAHSYLRMAQMHDSLGMRDKAAGYYARFVARWKDCDPELRPLVDEARRRIARLRE